MTKPSQQQDLLVLPPEMQILYNQQVTTDKNVMGLYPLIDLLTKPDDQKESLGERLAELLRTLTETLQDYQAQQAQMKLAFEALEKRVATSTLKIQQHQDMQEKKIDKILTMLNLPLD